MSSKHISWFWDFSSSQHTLDEGLSLVQSDFQEKDTRSLKQLSEAQILYLRSEEEESQWEEKAGSHLQYFQ